MATVDQTATDFEVVVWDLSLLRAPPLLLAEKDFDVLWRALGDSAPATERLPAADRRAAAAFASVSTRALPWLRARVRPVPTHDKAWFNRCLADLDDNAYEAAPRRAGSWRKQGKTPCLTFVPR